MFDFLCWILTYWYLIDAPFLQVVLKCGMVYYKYEYDCGYTALHLFTYTSLALQLLWPYITLAYAGHGFLF